MLKIFKEVSKNYFICKTTIFVPDQPGSLAKLANMFAKRGINITYFYYNRSEHSNRVIIEGKHEKIDLFKDLKEELDAEGYFNEIYEEDLQITNLGNILKISAFLENKPGTLASLANLLRIYKANVIYMIYNEMVSENRANIAFYVKDTEQVKNLLHRMNTEGYHYSIEYSGEDEERTNKVIGLNLLEKFYFKLSSILDNQEIENIRRLIESSKGISETLIRFNRESGKNLEEGEIFEKILTFSISSRTKTGEKFYYQKLPILPFGDVLLYCFKPPTGGNIYIFKHNNTYTMIDGTYGIYYEDIKKMLRENGIEPSKIERIYISHADADHAGLSGYFEDEFGTEIYMHRDSKGIIDNENRSSGINTPISELNRNFTILVNTFTKSKFPRKWKSFENSAGEKVGDFKVIDKLKIGNLIFKVIESLGGHIPGQVFFLCEEAGAFFTADYLLNVASLRDDEKSLLNIPKILMTSTNVDSRLFRKEMNILTEFSLSLDRKLQENRRGLLIFPGHGDYYPAMLL